MLSIQYEALLKDQIEGQQLQIHARPGPELTLAGVDFAHVVVPALYLSGDAVDYFMLPDGRVLAYLVDVSGSGTAAALLCMFIKSMVRHSVAMNRELTASAVLTDVNRMLLAAETGKYATMICVIVDPAADHLQWAHGGHTPRPFFYSGGSCSRLMDSGKPVGLFAEVDYINHELALPDSFSFVLFSDGIFDCLPGEDFTSGEQLLAAQVAQADGNFGRLRDTLSLTQLQQMPDDISMLVISRKINE